MMVIDFTAEMVAIGLGVVGLLALAVVGIGMDADDSEREAMRGYAERVGAWWLSQSPARTTAAAKPQAARCAPEDGRAGAMAG